MSLTLYCPPTPAVGLLNIAPTRRNGLTQSPRRIARHAIVLGALLVAFMSAPCRADWIYNRFEGLPPDAIIGGIDANNNVIYLCRAELTPSSYQPGWTQKGDPYCHISYAGVDTAQTEFDYWIPSWRPVSLLTNPHGLIYFGGEGLPNSLFLRYPCWTWYDGVKTPGKYGTDYGACYFRLEVLNSTKPGVVLMSLLTLTAATPG